MLSSETYRQRRQQLRERVGTGLILLLGNNESPCNYPANTYEHRQDSTFLYYTGIREPGMALLLDVEGGRDTLFGDDFSVDDIVWMGPQPKVAELAARAAIDDSAPGTALGERLAQATGRSVHFLPPYRAENALRIEHLLGIRAARARQHASLPLILAVVAARAVKSAEEIAEIETALDASAEMYTTAMAMARPGLFERNVVAAMEEVVRRRGCTAAFPSIVTINGQTLHNHHYGNRLVEGRLLLIDAGCESPLGYASDITRTVPVGGKFSGLQRDLYETVLAMQATAIAGIRPGVPYRDLHLAACRVLVERLIDLGLMTGDPDEAVAAGAHALFMPHGLGHMMGLDVHDMEDLGETHVGYGSEATRSTQFGFSALRLGRPLKPGYVFTVEPGIYFIPALIAGWKGDHLHEGFIRYDRLEEFLTFGGIRIEDDALVTEDGGRVLGKPIPKKVAEVEALFG